MTLADMSVITPSEGRRNRHCQHSAWPACRHHVDALPARSTRPRDTGGRSGAAPFHGVATSQSTTGTEEAKDFKVVVTLDVLRMSCAPGSPPPPRSPPQKGQRALPAIQALTMFTPRPRRQGQGGGSIHLPATAKPTPQQGVFVVQKDAMAKSGQSSSP